MKQNTDEISEQIIKMLEEEHGKTFSEHFINFIVKREKFDFDAFRTREELDNYMNELEEFNKRR